MLVKEIDVELCVGEYDVVYSYTTTDVPQKGERIVVWKSKDGEDNKVSKTYLVLDREWHCRQWYNPSVILTVEEMVEDAGVVDSVDTSA